MYVINARNVNGALQQGLDLLHISGVESDSRLGKVLVMPAPVTTVYERPTERVLFWPARDANPFLHLFESLWMLGGRNDVTWLKRFSKNITKYSTPHGAYGYRWRTQFGCDQLKALCYELKNKNSRRGVLQMWSPEADLARSEPDVPCNCSAFLWIAEDKLNITVNNRSNDIIWGAYGTNAVQFSMLLEYLAGCLNVGVGRYWQMSNNFHAYRNVYDPLMKLRKEGVGAGYQPYHLRGAYPYPLFSGEHPDEWDLDLALFLDNPHAYGYRTRYFNKVIIPLISAWSCYEKKTDPDRFKKALSCAILCDAVDWRGAAVQWLQRRQAAAIAKPAATQESLV